MFKKKIRAGVLLYALFMAAVFSLLLQFYLNRQVANQRNYLAQHERETAYAMAVLTKDNLTGKDGTVAFDKGTSHYQTEEDTVRIRVEMAQVSYQFYFPLDSVDSKKD